MTTTTDTTVDLARRLLIAFEAAEDTVVDDVIHPAYVDHAPRTGPAARTAFGSQSAGSARPSATVTWSSRTCSRVTTGSSRACASAPPKPASSLAPRERPTL